VVHPADLPFIFKEENWPPDALWIREDFLMSDEGAQRANWTPRFLLGQDRKIVLTVTGNDGWKDKMWPKILEITGTRA
jgi:hypothetical protein